MILRELVETEYAMAARSGPAALWPVPTMPWSLDRWHRSASSAATWEGAPLRQPSTCTEHPPSCRSSPAAVRPPPVYPHVERSPSPVGTRGSLEYCQSPSKQTLTKETLMPGVANAGVRPMGSAFIRQEVTPEHNDVVGGERKADLGDGDGLQPSFESGKQSSGQRKAAETTTVGLINESGWRSCQYSTAGQDNVGFKQQKQLEFKELAPDQPQPGSGTQQQECRSSGATEQRMSGYLELCQLPSNQTRMDKTLMPLVSNTRPTRSASREVAPRDRSEIGGEPKADVDKIGNQSCAQRKADESAMEAQIERLVQSPHGYMPAGQGVTAYNEQEGIELCELRSGSDTKLQQEYSSHGARDCPFSGYVEVELCRSPSKQTLLEILVPAAANGSTQPTQSPGITQAVGGESKVDVENGHAAQPLHEIKNQSGQKKVEESAMEGLIDKPLQPLRNRLTMPENTPYNEHMRIEFSEPTPERTSSGLKRRLIETTTPVKKPKPFKEFSCAICQVHPPSQHNLEEHLAGRLHQSNVEALQAKKEPAELYTNATPGVSNKNFAWDSESLRQDGKENIGSRRHQPSVKDRLELPASRWTCNLCQAKCLTESDYYEHLRGRRHRENTEAEFRSQSERRDEDAGTTAGWDWKRSFYCDVCDLQCNSEKMLASHLGGRRHREALEAGWRK
ncbi:hypothetical protein QOZ80_6AG0535490 [Eleusine coracana subsp. coracana]|nr:hypothetical protein QOZ80_6AG0535490 [Eleusine coracana subsp. coracana]